MILQFAIINLHMASQWIKNNKKTIYLFCTVILIFLLFSPALKTSFLFDDYSSIVENPAIRTLNLNKIASFCQARFIGYLSFALNFHFSKLEPFYYSLTNICIHILFFIVCFHFFQILWQTPSGKAMEFSDKEKMYLSMGAAFFIGIHPMSIFAVSYIVQRLASLTALFFVSCLFCYISLRLTPLKAKKAGWFFLFCIFLACALNTKQNAFTIFPIIILLEMFCFNPTKKKIAAFFLGMTFITIGFVLLIKYNLIDLNEIRRMTTETIEISRLQYLTNQFPVLLFYMCQIFWPNRLIIDYDSIVHSSYIHPDIIIPGIILGLIIFFAVLIGFNKNLKLAGFGILFYFISISVESSIIPIRDLVFIHRTYLPNVGLFFSISVLFYSVIKRIKLNRFFFLGIIIVSGISLSIVTLKTNFVFQNPVKIWQRVVEISPKHSRGYSSLSKAYINIGMYDKAQEIMFKAIRLNPKNLQNFMNLSAAYAKQGKYEQAIRMLKEILNQGVIDKRYVPVFVNLGNVYTDTGKYDLALKTYKQGLKYDKNNFELLLNLGQNLVFEVSDKQAIYEGLDFLEKAQAINDKHPVIFYSKGIAFVNLKKNKLAKENFQYAISLKPDFIEAKLELKKLQGS